MRSPTPALVLEAMRLQCDLGGAQGVLADSYVRVGAAQLESGEAAADVIFRAYHVPKLRKRGSLL